MSKECKLCSLVCLSLLILCSHLYADAQSDFEMLFGEEARKVAATPDTADDVRLAAKLLDAAGQLKDAQELQVLLYRKAYEFAMAGDGDVPLALRAVRLLEKADPQNAAAWREEGQRLKTLLPERPGGASLLPEPNIPEAEWPDPLIRRIRPAVRKGVAYLWSRQNPDGSWDAYQQTDRVYPAGPTALVCYALLECGVSPRAQRMEKALEWLAKDKSDDKTYTLALRCQVWLLANPRTNNRYQDVFKQDLDALIKSTKDGGYSYPADGTPRTRDNSNAQFGLLGVWAGARANSAIPNEYWSKVLDYWLRGQHQDGSWSYMPTDNLRRPAMTAAGLASLFVCMDHHPALRHGRAGPTADLANEAIRKGMQWFERHFPETVQGIANTYYLFSVERIGFACGYKYFGATDWFSLGAEQLLNCQAADGAFNAYYCANPTLRNKVVSTAFALLFLGRGLKPVLFSRLVRDNEPPARPADLVSLCHWLYLTFERIFYWQLVNSKTPVRDWHDAPIMFMTGHDDPKFTDTELAKLRAFVLQGGIIFSCPSGSAPFCRGIRETYKKLFPSYELRKLEPSHSLYACHFDLKGQPAFYMIDNGIRPLVIHSDSPLPLHFAPGDPPGEWGLRAMANVYLYVVGNGVLCPRGVDHWPLARRKPQRTERLAQLACTGFPNPEPLAFERFSNMLVDEIGIKIQALDSVPIVILNRTGAKYAFWAGTGSLKLNDQQKTALKDWIRSGGTLIVDAVGSPGLVADADAAKAFADDVLKLLAELFGADSVVRSTAFYSLPGQEIRQLSFRNLPVRRREVEQCPLEVCMVDGRPAVILCRDNLAAGLVGYTSGIVRGYSPETAYQVMRNILLYGQAVDAPRATK